MKFYKNNEDKLYSYEDDVKQSQIKDGLTEITESEFYLIIEQGSEFKRIEDICLNIVSIIHKLCPDMTISTDSIRVLATEPSTLTTLK